MKLPVIISVAALLLPSGVCATDAATVMALARSRTSRSAQSVGAIVTPADGPIPQGIEIRERIGDRCIVSASPEALAAALADGSLSSVAVSRRLSLHNNLSATGTYVNEVHLGVKGHPYTGKGVITGLFDDGFDIRHINFRDSDGESRIKAVFHYTADDGTVTEYIDNISDFIYDTADMTHGTHVLGTMAGSYSGECRLADMDGTTVSVTTAGCPYAGSATESEIAIACGELYDANILAGVKRISDYAGEVGKPCVINLSLGSVLGPRDGTDATTATLSALAKDAVIVVSAGNDADKGKTFSHDFTAERPHCGAAVRPWTSDGDAFVIDIWSKDSQVPEAEIAIIKASTGAAVKSYPFVPGPDGIMTVDTTDPDFASHFTGSISLAFSANESTNNRAEYWAEADMGLNADDPELWGYNIAVMLRGTPGMHVDVAYEGDNSRLLQNPGTPWWIAADSNMSISSMACGDGIISVGSWTTRNAWGCLDGTVATHGNDDTFPVGKIARYSSFGTTVDGRSYPTVAAPGNMILSSYSAYYLESHDKGACVAEVRDKGTDFYWGSYAGTSMASPAVAGAVALWLEACPTLTSAQVCDIIKRTADPFADNTVQCGSGRFNALRGIVEVIENGGINEIEADGSEGASYAADLAGRRYPYPSALAPGIYIIRHKGRTFKQIVKSPR